MTVVKTIRAVFVADTADYVSDVKKAENASEDFSKQAKSTVQSADKFGASISTLKNVAGALIGAGVLVKAADMVLGFGRASLDAVGSVEQLQGKFDTVFKSLAEGVASDLGTMADAIKRSKYELMGFAATFQDTFVPLGFARGEAAEFSVVLTELAYDLSAFNDIPAADAARDLQSAIVGNTETMRKYGVVAQETQIKQKALELGLWDGKGAIDAQAKALAIYNIILAGTTDAQGAAIREADSMASKNAQLAASTLNLQVAVGEKLAPAYEWFITQLTNAANAAELLITWDDRVKEALAEHTETVMATSTSYETYRDEMLRSLVVVGDLAQDEADLILQYQEGNVAMSDMAAHAETLMQGLGVLGEAAWENSQDVAQMREQYERQRDVFGEVASAADDVAESVAGITFELKELSATQIASQVVSDLNKALADGKISQEDYADAMITVGDEILELPPDVVAANIAMAGLRKEFEDGDLSLFSYIDKANQLADVMAELDGTEANLRVIFTIVGADALENLGVTAGDIGINPHDIPATPDAMGSRVYPGEARLVGEGGRPEVFIPDVSGHIEPLTSSNAPGGNTFVYNAYSEGAAALALAQIDQARSSRLNSRM